MTLYPLFYGLIIGGALQLAASSLTPDLQKLTTALRRARGIEGEKL